MCVALFTSSTADAKELKQKTSGAINVTYGKYFLFRTNGHTYAIQITLAGKPEEGAINYIVRRRGDGGDFAAFAEGRTDDKHAGSGWLKTEDFKLEWSWNIPTAGWLYIGRLPKGTEFYNEQVESLEVKQGSLDAKRWVPARIF